MRSSAWSFMSSLLPKVIAPVGHVFTHAGSRPTETRSEHSVHLYALLSFFDSRGTLKGQPVMHEPQPMQCSSTKSTIPLLYWTIAPGDGQAFRQPGSAQCMQPSLRISHSSRPSCSTYSVKRITVHDSASRSAGLSYTPTLWPIASRRSFHSPHATWQALQ